MDRYYGWFGTDLHSQAVMIFFLMNDDQVYQPSAAMQVYNTAEWLQEDSTNNEMRMHATILLCIAIHSMNYTTV
jgi:hypothetical protein